MPEIHIDKARRRLRLIDTDCIILDCSIGLGSCPVGHKQAEGDGRTPEGIYYVCTRNHRSKYTLFLGLSYPSPADAQAAFQHGSISSAQLDAVIHAHKAKTRPPWDTPLGGQIGIHGGGIAKGDGLADSTVGCIALLNDDIRRLWAFAPLGTPVYIHA
jgi:murein L,D-transpeptidase YafK